MSAMGVAARAEYEAKYTPERNLAMLTGIYKHTLEICHSPKRRSSAVQAGKFQEALK
jgi:hypothetical protein